MASDPLNARELLQQFQINDSDLQALRNFGETELADVNKLISDFYTWMEEQVWYDQFFSKGVPAKVQALQCDYWRAFLLAEVNNNYVNQRVTVGRVHATINLPVTAYLAGMNFAQNWFSTQAREFTQAAEDLIALLSAINKLIQLDCNIVMHVYSLQSMEAVRQQGEITRKIVNEATKVVRSAAKGDFDVIYQRQDESDALEKPINRMITSLKQFSVETEKEKWLKSGIADLALAMRGGLSIDELCDNAIGFLAQYLNAQVGVFYVVTENGNAVLSASYAYTRRKNLSSEIKAGEGLVGQVLKEGKAIVLSGVPEDYITINSGLGEHTPREIMVQPLIYEQKVKGIIELGSFQSFSNDQIDFLAQVGESIAVAIKSAQDQAKMRSLLEEAQQTSEKLQYQQEELEAANQTLEDQAQALKQSEEELTAQKDMLEESNRELQLKTTDLERQKSEIENARLELQKKADQLANSSKYKSEFLANMSHELRTPLNSLLLLSQTLIANKEGNLTDDQIEDIRVIYSGGTSLLTLINDILDLSKVEAGKMKAINDKSDVTELIKKLQRQFSASAKEKNLKFEVQCDEAASIPIVTDQHRLEQILRNLLSNAFKFTHSGSVKLHVHIPTQSEQIPANTPAEQCIAFSVTDTGIGIPKKSQMEIFEAFQQADGSTSRSYGGTGLGLTISRQLAQLLGGDIYMSSQEGVGSQFTLCIPKHYAQPESDDKATSSIENFANLHAQKHTTAEQNTSMASEDIFAKQAPEDCYLLIVEDDPHFGKALCQLATEHHFKPLLIDKGMEALKLVLTHSPKAVILDMGLPDTDGLKVLESLKATPQTRHIPVHIISSKDQDQETLNKGALGFLTKPASSEDLEKVFSKFETLIQKNIQHILIIEDDAPTRKFLSEYLQKKNISIYTSESGASALDQLRKQHIDVCVLDLNLKDMSGIEWLRKIDDNPDLTLPPIIIYTAKDLNEDEFKQLRKYTDKIVIKDGSSPERLQEEVELFLHSIKQRLPPSIKDSHSKNRDTHSLKGRKVLLVDDDLRNVYALSKVLKEQGLDVSFADNGQLAVEKLKKNQNVDLVLMDIMMPVMDGYEAMRIIRSNISSTLPIIALTAKAMSADREKCIEAGANDYMSKPVDVNNLVSMLKVWCYH